MLKMIPVPIPNTWLFWLLLLASFFFGIPASEAAFLKNMPSGAKNYFLTDLSPDQSPKHEDSCWFCGHKTQKSVSGVAEELIRLTYPDFSTEEILRDVMGRPIKISYTASISGSGGSLPSQSDPNSLSTPTPSEELFLSYSQAGDLLKIESKRNFFRDGQPVTSESQSIIQTFDILGRLTSRTLPFLQRRVEYEYNAASELVTKREINTKTQAVRTTQLGYTTKGQLASLNENGSTTLFEYSPGGKITKITYPEGITKTLTYSPFGELASQILKTPDNTILHEISYEYNPNGKIIRLTTPEGQTQNSYDSESRLIQTIHPDGNTETFAFNTVGYLSEKKDNSRRLLMNYNESGQVVEVLEYIPPTAPTHTSRQVWNWYADGLLRSIANTTTNTATYYLWNAKKKLEGVAFTDGTSTAYAYLPGSDLRLSSVDRTGAATLFHWDGVQLREVLNPSQGSGANSPPMATAGRVGNLPTDSNPANTITSAYLTGQPGTWDEVLTASVPAGENPENLLLFLQNHQSSVIGTLETSNPLISRQFFNYLAYGEPKGTSPESLPLAGIGYTGRQHDDTGLMYYRGRYRDSCTGAFIQEDPLRDGYQWYGYVGGDPVNYVDPAGFYKNDLFMPGVGADGLGGGGPLSNSEISALPPVSDHHAQFLGGLAGFTSGLVAGAVGGSILGPVSLGMSEASLLAPFAPVFANALADQWADFQNSSVSEKAFTVGSLIGGGCGFGTGRSLFTPKPAGLLSRYSKEELIANALQPINKEGLTAIARALTKHATGQRTSGTFPPLKGNIQQINTTAEQLLREIMGHPEAIVENLGRGGLSIRRPDRRGVAFNADGKLSGFLD